MARSTDTPLSVFLKNVREAEQRLNLLTDACAGLTAGPDFETVDTAPALRKALQRLPSVANAAITALERAAADLEERLARDIDTYSARVADALRISGHEPVGDIGRPVIDGRVYLEIDAAGPSVRLNGRTLTDLRPHAVALETQKALGAIATRAQAPAEFLAALKKGYDDLLSERNAVAGTQVHIADLHMKMVMARQSAAFRRDPRSATFTEYPLELFRSDLYQALLERTPVPGGGVLHVESGADTKGAIFMLLPSVGRLGYAGRLWIESLSP